MSNSQSVNEARRRAKSVNRYMMRVAGYGIITIGLSLIVGIIGLPIGIGLAILIEGIIYALKPTK